MIHFQMNSSLKLEQQQGTPMIRDSREKPAGGGRIH